MIPRQQNVSSQQSADPSTLHDIYQDSPSSQYSDTPHQFSNLSIIIPASDFTDFSESDHAIPLLKSDDIIQTKNISDVFPQSPKKEAISTKDEFAFAVKTLEEDAQTESQIHNLIDFPIHLSLKNEHTFLIKAEYDAVSMLTAYDADMCLEAQIMYMVHFFVHNFTLTSQKEMNEARVRYQNNQTLAAAFDILFKKYSKANRSREEIIKWILRKLIKTTKKDLKRTQKMHRKELLDSLCKRYFTREANDPNSEVPESLLPFRKNSKNKTMNHSFMTELFRSEDFKKDYENFIKDLDAIGQAEDIEKILRFSQVVIECAKKNEFSSVAKYKRVPWLRIWREKAKDVALQLHEGNFARKQMKKPKINE